MRWLLAIAAIGLTLRVAYVVATNGDVLTPDGVDYYLGAKALANGEGFIDAGRLLTRGIHEPSAEHPPAWTVLLAGPSFVGISSVLQQQLLTCLLGTATVVLVGIVGRRLAGPRAGLIAAAFSALYPNLWMHERLLLLEPLMSLAAAAAIFLTYEFTARPRLSTLLCLGALCGLIVLVRAEQALLLAVLLVPAALLARDVSWRLRLRWLGLAVLAAVVVIAPWVVYNLGRFDHRVLLTTNFGRTVAQGNCDLTYHGPQLGYLDTRCPRRLEETYGSDKARRDYAAGATDASTVDLEFRRTAQEYVRDHLGRVPLVVLAREGRAWGVFRPFDQMRQEFRGTRFVGGRPTKLWVFRAAFASYWVLALLAIAGVIVLRRRHVPVYPLLAFVVTVVISVALTFGQTRYRAPAEVSIVLLAAVAADALWRRFLARAP
jgi:4-amino-4-deoxy-L-arabinose transferase-like glycosyltransferase